MMSRILRRITHIFHGILWAAVGTLAFYLTVFFITAGYTGIPSFFGYRPYFILSDSMEPTIKPHQFILTQVTDAADVTEGDIIVYKKSGGDIFGYHVIRRVISIRSDGFILKGDHNPTPDQAPVSPEQVLYRVVWH